MRFAFKSLLVLVLACAEPETFDPDVSSAYKSLVDAVRAKDGTKLWEMTPDSARKTLKELYLEISDVVSAASAGYPEVDRVSALASLGASLVEGARDERDFFLALLDFGRVKFDAAADAGMAVESLTVQGDEASLTTRAGEVFRFVKEGGVWKSTAIQVQLDLNPTFKRLRANLAVARSNLASWDKAAQETTDRSKPEGAFNVFFESVKRGARVMVYELLSPASREPIKKAVVSLKEYQAALEKRFPALPARQALLAERKFAWTERVGDEKAFFAALWDTGALAADLPIGSTAAIDKVKSQGPEKALIDVKLDGNRRTFVMTRDDTKRWGYAGLEATLEREGLRRVEAEMRHLDALPTPPAP